MSLMVSLREAAEVIGISASHAYELNKRGEFPIPVEKLGTTYRVSRRQLEAFCNGEAS